MAITSVKDFSQVFVTPPQWIPNPFKWVNYVELFERYPYHLYFFNSLYIAVLVTAGTCIVASMAGYAIAKLSFPLKNGIFLLLLSSMMIPNESTAIPLFVWFGNLGVVDTHFPLIVPAILGAGGTFGVFLMRQFFLTIPNELGEAARIDGCSPLRLYWNIMLPLATPAIATLSILTFLGSWNEFFDPLIYLHSSELYTIPLALAMFTDEGGVKGHLMMAASMVATVPILTVFFVAQRHFIEGISMSGVK
ncbi:carbohydrate ABC transporter permease [Paenibacillus antri]|uniref:Carbohydrate ABC transporter permease n=2 Tax=Paenibacillus antri TaxID=2582848 RepID=A0A5R9GHJ9_9BACL|nr:carbohydrate ABC transporter permease [Paenibacillus antri]